MVWQMILHMSALKNEKCPFDNLPLVKEAVIVLLHQFPHVMACIEGTGYECGKQKVIIAPSTMGHIYKQLQMCNAEQQFSLHRICPDFLSPSNG
jgi:hypothetical protein